MYHMKITFIGTSQLSALILSYLIEWGYNIVFICTKLVINVNRNFNIYNPVFNVAKKYQLKTIFLDSLDNFKEKNIFKAFKIKLVLIVSYGFLIPDKLLLISKLIFINMHPSRLSKWRGSCPLHRTVASCNDTSICIIKLNNKLDSSDIFFSKKIKLYNSCSTYQLQEYMVLFITLVLKKIILIFFFLHFFSSFRN